MKKQIILLAAVCITSLSSFAQFSFIHISDLHISNTAFPNSDLNGEKFICSLEEFAGLNPKPAFVIVSGDVSNMGNRAPDGMYPTITQHLFPPAITNPGTGAYFIDSAQTIPIYFTPGNHEYWASINSQQLPVSNDTIANYSAHLAPDEDYAITNDIAVIVFLRSGSDVILGKSNIKGNGLSGKQCTWLRNVLSLNSGKRKIIVMHHPGVNAEGTNSDGSPFAGAITDTSSSSIFNNRTVFLNICDSNRVDIVLTGHEHQNVVADRKGNVKDEDWSDGTRYIQTAAGFNRSYRIIKVDPAFVTAGIPLLSCNSGSGIQDFSILLNLSIFPNPAGDRLTLECDQKAEIEIGDIEGHILKRLCIIDYRTTLNISELPPGIYIIKARTITANSVNKIIKL